jgi:hypothetical protein
VQGLPQLRGDLRFVRIRIWARVVRAVARWLPEPRIATITVSTSGSQQESSMMLVIPCDEARDANAAVAVNTTVITTRRKTTIRPARLASSRLILLKK